MRTTVRLLLAFAIVGLVALPAQAHTIAVRGTGGGSTSVCDAEGNVTGAWEPLDPIAEFENNCFVEIFSIDFQIGAGPLGEIVPTHPPGGVEPSDDPDNIFDTVQLVSTEFGPAYRFFSSEGNFIDCFTCGIGLVEASLFINPFFEFVADADGDLAEWVRIVDINQDPNVVPEPASLLLLGSGLVGMALKRRRRADPRL